MFAPKLANGSWADPFDPFAWGGAAGEYTEASAWQYRLYVPHEPRALRDAYAAANRSMCEALEDVMSGGTGVNAPGATYHEGAWGLHHEQVKRRGGRARAAAPRHV